MATSANLRCIVGLTALCFVFACELNILEKLSLKHQMVDTTDPCVAPALCNGRVTRDCLDAILTTGNDVKEVENVICNSLCDSLFRVTVHCKGEEYTHEVYRLGCPNGYQGPKNSHWIYYM